MKVNRPELHQPAMPSAHQPFKKLLEEAAAAPKKQVPALPPPLPKKQPLAVPPRLPTGRAVAQAATSTLSAGAVAVKATAVQQGEARTRVVAEASRLDGVRVGYEKQAQVAHARREDLSASAAERIDGRMLDLICKELERSLDGLPAEARSRLPAPLPSAPRPAPQPAEQPQQPTPTAAGAEGPTPAQVEGTRSAQAMALIERIEVFVRSARPALRLALHNSLGAEVEVERVGPRRVALKLVGTKGPPAADAVARIREELQARGLSIAALAVG